ncbi:hypothetical protein [Streptomyces sp. ISL-111]|uniref:hypothetical protein n=1 Tax=Streptomyces sp. ISL-111 TaxID=2819175 RepID=UPI0027E3B896|nr:hypothetical protein [Streptomyces sp. ISL-111]
MSACGGSPLLAHERRHLRSAVADRVNCSHRRGDTVQVALFMADFVTPGTRWAHLDVAAPVWNDEPAYGEVPQGATGFGVRTLLETLRALADPGHGARREQGLAG